MSVALGVDLGGTKIEIIALDDAGRVLLRRRQQSPRNSYQATIAAIRDLVQGAEAELAIEASLGFGTPGAISPATGLLKNSNSTWLNGHPLDRDLAAALGRPISMANDADCLALSEATDGAATGAASVFAVIIGTGVGGGLAIHGQVLAGPNAIAGEWGHNPLPWPRPAELPGPACYCGLSGCIETWLSGPGLARDHQAHDHRAHDHGPGADSTGATATTTAGPHATTATGTDNQTRAEAVPASGQGPGAAPPAMAPPAITAAAAAGDPQAEATLHRYEDRLARGLATIINVLDPSAIVLGGGLSQLDRLYQNVPARWDRYVFSDTVRTRLLRAVHGDSSGVRGAAWLGRHQALVPPETQVIP